MHLGAGLSACLTSVRWAEYLETYFKTFAIFLLLQFYLMPLVVQKFSSASQIHLGKRNTIYFYHIGYGTIFPIKGMLIQLYMLILPIFIFRLPLLLCNTYL